MVDRVGKNMAKRWMKGEELRPNLWLHRKRTQNLSSSRLQKSSCNEGDDRREGKFPFRKNKHRGGGVFPVVPNEKKNMQMEVIQSSKSREGEEVRSREIKHPRGRSVTKGERKRSKRRGVRGMCQLYGRRERERLRSFMFKEGQEVDIAKKREKQCTKFGGSSMERRRIAKKEVSLEKKKKTDCYADTGREGET